MASQRDDRDPSRNRRDRGAQAAIQRAALSLFGTKGFATTTVQEIVDRAGVTKGAFYHWYPSKDDLLRQIHDTFIDDQLRRAHDVVGRGLSPRLELAELIAELVESVDQHREEITIFIRESRLLSDVAMAEVRRKRDELAATLTGSIERGVAAGALRPSDAPHLLAFGIFGMCAWVTEWYRPEGPRTAREIAEIYASMVLDGLAADDAS